MSGRYATQPTFSWALLAVGALCTACTARIEGQADGAALPDQSARGGVSAVAGAGAGAGGGSGSALLATSPLRRFTSFEYDNAVRDLLGTALGPGEAFLPQQREGTFDNDVGNLTVSTPLVEQYLQAAELLAAEATSDAELPRLLECELAELTEACALQALAAVGKRAYRRPLSDAELSDLATTFQEGQVAGGIKTGLEFALGRILISPSFLYWVELGAPDAAPLPGGRVPLTGFEVASRISRLLLGSIPDSALLEAAERGTLQAASERQAHAKRLLRAADGAPTAGASRSLAQFHAGWLGLSELQTMTKGLPGWSRELATSMRAETEAFLADLVWSRADSSEMFRAHHGFVDARLAPLYGVAPPGSELVRTELDARTRSGLLTQASFMALTSNDNPKPMKRAAFVLGKILCSPTPPPPPDAPQVVPEGTPGTSERERFEHLTGVAPCTACHTALNGVGWSFGSYDALGATRSVDALGAAIDTQGTLSGTDVDGAFADAVGLSQRLADSAMARSCLVRHWFRFDSGRFETDADVAALAELGQAFDASGHRVEDLLLAMVAAEDFTSRFAE